MIYGKKSPSCDPLNNADGIQTDITNKKIDKYKEMFSLSLQFYLMCP